MGKHRTFLDQVVGHKREVFALRENCRLVLQGAIFEVIDQMAGDLVSVDDFGRIALSNYISVQRAEHQESVRQTFLVSDRYGVGAETDADKTIERDQYRGSESRERMLAVHRPTLRCIRRPWRIPRISFLQFIDN